jgi:cytochrome c peroxidase
VANKLGHVTVDPAADRVTSKLPALHLYQLSIPAPKPEPNVDFNADAAKRGDNLFSGKAKCTTCHHKPLWTEPGWNAHHADEIGIDSFQADRSPGKAYKTQTLAAVFVRENGLFMKPENKGRFYHDGRFKTLLDVVNHYNQTLGLALTQGEKDDLVEYLKSLTTI